MPISYHANGEAQPSFLIPAPFVSISKSFEKAGNGEILGTTYNITLTGTMIADRGSPDKDGAFVTDGIDPTPDSLEAAEYYKSLQKKQRALSNLFSKKNEGGQLHVQHVAGDGTQGFKCFPTVESIDFEAHNPGNPTLSSYSITLTSNHLIYPDGVADNDDWKDKWLINNATETWDIQENEKRMTKRKHVTGDSKSPHTGTCDASAFTTKEACEEAGTCKSRTVGTCGDGESKDQEACQAAGETWLGTGISDYTDKKSECLANGGYFTSTNTWTGGDLKEKIDKVDKIYTVTHTVSAVGKRKFDRDSTQAPGFETDGFFTQFDEEKNQEAWQQARGFVYDLLKYGKSFTKGEDGILNNKDDYDRLGLNLPDSYEGYNYNRTQTVDHLGGSFQVNETWTFAPDHSKVLETIDFNVSEDPATGFLSVTVNGSIEGLVDPPSMSAVSVAAHCKDSSGATTSHETQTACESVEGNVWHPAVEDPEADVDIGFNLETSSIDSKFEQARKYYDEIQSELHLTATSIVQELADYSPSSYGNINLNKEPTSKTVGMNPNTGIITYNYSFSQTPLFTIPGCKTESVQVNDTYPGRVFASTAVIGRKLGPVLQNINTQTEWKRSLSIECNVDINRTIVDGVYNKNKVTPKDGTTYYGDAMKAKPSNVRDSMIAVKAVIDRFSPKGQTSVTKWFVDSPPTENWNPRTGSWSYSISWTYEMDDKKFESHSINNYSYGQYPSRWLVEDDSGERPSGEDFDADTAENKHVPGESW